MFSLLKFIILLIGLSVAAYFLLPFVGYELNVRYFTESKETCQTKVNQCTKEYIEQGTKNAKCDFNCIDPKLIIKKQ